MKNPIFLAQNPSKTSCNLPRIPWKRPRTSWSRPKGFWRTLRRPGARARGVRPASKLVPGLSCPEPFQNVLQLSQSSLEAPQSRSKALWRTPSGPAPARAQSGRPQNWSPAISSIENSMKNQYFLPRTVPKPSAIFLDLSGNATKLPGAAQVLSGRLSGAQAPARAESGRPQNWSLAFFCVHLQ